METLTLASAIGITPKHLEVKRRRYNSFRILTDAIQKIPSNSILYQQILTILRTSEHGIFSHMDTYLLKKDKFQILHMAHDILNGRYD